MKERATAAKHKLALSAWRSGAILTTAAGTGASSPQNRSLSLNGSVLSTASSSSSPSSSRRGSASGTPTGTSSRLSLGSQTRVKVQGQGQGLSLGSRQQSGKEEETSAWDVIEALDSQRSALEARNEELMDMLKELNLNLNNTSGDNKGDRDSFLLFDDSNADGNRMAEESVIDSSLASKGSPSSAGRPDSRITPLLTPTAAKMYDMITEQQKTIELADGKCDMWRVKVEDSETLNSHLRGRVQEMKEVRSNHILTQQFETALFSFFPPSIF